MQQFKDYFKNREEVEQYFGNEIFKFAFMSDNIMHFESLNPDFIDGELVVFEISLFYELGRDFFTYSGFKTWLDDFKLFKVQCKSQETHETAIMYFQTYTNE